MIHYLEGRCDLCKRLARLQLSRVLDEHWEPTHKFLCSECRPVVPTGASFGVDGNPVCVLVGFGVVVTDKPFDFFVAEAETR